MFVGITLVVALVFFAFGAALSWLVLNRRSREELAERDRQVWTLEGKLDRLRSELAQARGTREPSASGGPFRTASDEVSAENLAELPSTYSADVIAAKAKASAKIAEIQADADRKIAIANLDLEQLRERNLAEVSALRTEAEAERRRNRAELEHQTELVKASSEAELRKRKAELDLELEALRASAATTERRLRSELDHELEATKAKAEVDRKRQEAQLDHERSRHLLEQNRLNRDNARLATQVRALTRELEGLIAISSLPLQSAVEHLAKRVTSLTERIERAQETRDGHRIERETLERKIEAALEKLGRLANDPATKSYRANERARLESQREQIARDLETSDDVVTCLETELEIAARCLRDLERRLGNPDKSGRPEQ